MSDTILIIPYDPAWPALYEAEAPRILGSHEDRKGVVVAKPRQRRQAERRVAIADLREDLLGIG